VTAHDGFTLQDLVSYNDKHNEANQEDNRDGHEHNYSWNCGIEGPTDNPDIVQLRERQKRNLLATLMLSQGLPMLLAGDEFGHSQQGNNNAYCQDNESIWLDWAGIGEPGKALTTFTQKLIQLRREHIVFHRHRFFHGTAIPGTETKDVVWLKPDGEEMVTEDWHEKTLHSIALMLSGVAGGYHLTEQGEKEPDDTFMLIMNAADETLEYVLPENAALPQRTVMIDTSKEAEESVVEQPVSNSYVIGPRTLVLVRYRRKE
jgi:glycogen operon protein